LHLLFIGDVVGEPGRSAIATTLPYLRNHHQIDLVIANAENIADGKGVTRLTSEALFSLGVDVLTNGNHAWDKHEAFEFIKSEPRLLRPHNYPEGTPGSGWYIATTKQGQKVGIVNVLGNIFMYPQLSCPFVAVDHALAHKPKDVKFVLVDMHAEATSEKSAMGWYLDGRVSAVIGTHTHVTTADERILPKGTGFLTDVGMTGCYESIIGMDTQKWLKRLVQKLPEHLEVAYGEGTLCGVLLDLDEETGCCRQIKRIKIRESEVEELH